MLRRRLNKLWHEDVYQGIILHRTDSSPLKVSISSEWLQHVVDIVVSNAAKAMVDSAKKELYVSAYKKGDRAFVAIQDRGHGISEEQMAIIFKGKNPSETGHGVGLLMAQMILQTYGGDIQVAQTGPDGTTMEFWLPLIEGNETN